MTPALAGARLKSTIRDAAAAATDSAEFREVVLDAIRARVPYDGVCLATIDPAALVPTTLTTRGYEVPRAYASALEFEYGEDPQPGRFDSLLHREVPIRTLREVTGNRVRSSRQYAELLAPYGMQDEVRMLFRGRDGACWGACTMSRRPGPEFADEELETLGTVLTDIGEGLRTTLFRDGTRTPHPGSEGPAVAIVGPEDEFESITVPALEYFERLGWGPPGRPVPTAPAVSAALWLRRSGTDSAVLRARTLDGEWVVIRVGRFDGEHPPRRVLMTVERAQLPEIVSLAAAAHGLTRRESEVLTQVLAGRTRHEMARVLGISPYTVQDHLKAVFAKTGVNSRASLVAKLAHTEYVPRLGQRIGPDGFFTERRSPEPASAPKS
ncbi:MULTISPECIES: response regulator transcription factor [unclassified Rhodococcus (in: high G+C Gram-positive bacteria)]|uniref:response regulator transcription factor n=1 Tax=unclassified Rhodococcus (in: high G+C Gram-positive bacteria) TaxID=192944 RepID=UPI000927F484|nr:helix-turn-helix transcriptional regulator [Rhodococcus sp. M8]OLL19842.1 helix-turn-helix transcriptional regulator [Rhodococcus sp. M8]QPG43683.1 LuxR family transcriptional regulator [Rhodococcus sp. M8]